MGEPTVEETEARGAELDRREAALQEGEERLAKRTEELDSREAVLEQGGDSQKMPEGVTYAALPDPQEGNGFVVIEAPLPLVAVFAALHPSERGTVSAQMAGAMRQTLMETGKLRSGRRAEPVPEQPVELAIVTGADTI